MATMVYPSSADTRLLLAEIYEQQKNYDQAVTAYESSVSMHPSVESYIGLARVHRAMNQNALALGDVNEALKLEPGHSAALAMKLELQKLLPQKRSYP
jgi:tetratricopeptide (TPR) repeat protein